MERRGRENVEVDVGDIRDQNSVSEVAVWGRKESKLEDRRPWAAVRVPSPFSCVTVCLQSTSAVTHFLGTEKDSGLNLGLGCGITLELMGVGSAKKED